MTESTAPYRVASVVSVPSGIAWWFQGIQGRRLPPPEGVVSLCVDGDLGLAALVDMVQTRWAHGEDFTVETAGRVMVRRVT